MPDNPRDGGLQDDARISVERDYERQYWARKLGVTPDELVRAVDEVGHSASAVARQLGKGDLLQ